MKKEQKELKSENKAKKDKLILKAEKQKAEHTLQTAEITASIVTYSNDKNIRATFKGEILRACAEHLSNNDLIHSIAIIDNSPTRIFEWTANINPKITYSHNNGLNPGFGAGHNKSIHILPAKKYHMIINPDIVFEDEGNCIKELFEYMEANNNTSLVQPMITDYQLGKTQYLCKENPTLLAQALRGFAPKSIKKIFRGYNEWYEMRRSAYKESAVESQYLSGAFMFIKRKDLDSIGWFDSSYFMYLEDADITRRLSSIGKCVHLPTSRIQHVWEKRSHKNNNLRIIAIKSYLTYAKKWGLKLY